MPLWLPPRPPLRSAAHERDKVIPVNDDKLILVVEDDPHIIRAVSLRLRAAGYRVIEAHDGQEGFELARRALPHVIVADIRMPVMDGFTMLAKLRAVTGSCLIPSLVFSANVAESAKAQARQLGVVCFIEKPYSFASLIRGVELVLQTQMPARPPQGPETGVTAVQ